MQQRNDKIRNGVAVAIIALGVVLRLVIYFQDRNLFLDEVNVARNLYERNLWGLAHPLIYEQFAPILFLWAEKICAALLGYGEYALRLVPLLCAIATLYMMYRVALLLRLRGAWWYPLVLLALAPLLLRYATELKQYSSDAFVTTALVLLALRTPLHTTARSRFVLLWGVAGTLAIWASMTAIFILVGVGGYYAMGCIQHAMAFTGRRERRAVLVQHGATLVLATGIWAAVFAFYFFTILQAQANDPMLLTFHHDDFMSMAPHTFWWHNWPLFNSIVRKFGDHFPFTYTCNLWLMMLGTAVLLVRRPAVWLLLAAPVVCMVGASYMGKYSMAIRLTIFAMPLFVAMAGYGLQQLYGLLRARAWRVVVTAAALVVASDNVDISILQTPMRVQQVTEGLSFLQQRHITGPHLIVSHTAAPAYIYYTTIHPTGRIRWASLSGALLMHYNYKTDSLARDIQQNPHTLIPAPDGFLLTGMGHDEVRTYVDMFSTFLHLTDSMDHGNVQAYIYTRK